MKVVSIHPLGRLGNLMFQYMNALSIRAHFSETVIANINIPEWNINTPQYLPIGNVYRHTDVHRGHPASLAALLERGGIDWIDFISYGMRMENLLPVDFYREIFKPQLTELYGFGQSDLVINIRGKEILDARHPHYTLVPIEYYEEIISMTGLNPIFMGQIDDNHYTAALRKRFKGAVFIPSRGAAIDFETIRSSINVLPSVSTFSWLACWLSRAERIFMPLTGLFNPFQHRSTDFTPIDDNRYFYTLFPANYSIPVTQYNEFHAPLINRWAHVSGSELSNLKSTRSNPIRTKDRYVRFFDEDFYLNTYQDVRKQVPSRIHSGLFHYIQKGFSLSKKPFALDIAHYVKSYPDAAEAIGFGLFCDPHHHYVEVGHELGYQRVFKNASFQKI